MTDLPERGTGPAPQPETTTAPESVPSSEVLPQGVASAGVTIHPTTIPIPDPVAQMGVKPVGANIPMPTSVPNIPISDEQIAVGLGKSIKESFRWLAEWCIRRLKQVHIGLLSVRGKLTRVTIHA